MKTKRLLSAALVMCMAVSLAGCSDEDSSSSKRNSKNDTSSSEAAVTTADPKDEQTTTTTTTAATTTTAYEPEPEPVVTADYDLDGYEADLAFDFSEGKGWILKDNTLIAVTNKGEELFTLSSSGIVYVSPFKDGCAFVVHKRDDKTCYEEIYDTSGRMLYSTADFDTSGGISEEHIVIQGDDEFLVLRHESGLRENRWLAGTINSNGSVVNDFRAYDGLDDNWGGTTEINSGSLPGFLKNYSLTDECFYDNDDLYLGDGIYFLGGQNIALRPKDGTAFYVLSGHGEPMGNADNSKVMFLHTGTGGYSVYDFNKKSAEDIGTLSWDNSLYGTTIHLDRGYAEGIIFSGHNFHDITGKNISDLPDFKDLHMTCSRFDNGSCLAAIRGADDSEYITVLDKKGKQRFEPFVIKDVTKKLHSGYFATMNENNLWTLYDISGKRIRDLCTGNNCYISDGIVRLETSDGSKLVWKVYTLPMTDEEYKNQSTQKDNDKKDDKTDDKTTKKTDSNFAALTYTYTDVLGKNLYDALGAFDRGFSTDLGNEVDNASFWINDDPKASVDFPEVGSIDISGIKFTYVSISYTKDKNNDHDGEVITVAFAMANTDKSVGTSVTKKEAKAAYESLLAQLTEIYGKPVDYSAEPMTEGSEYKCVSWENTNMGKIDLFWGDNLWGDKGYNNCYICVSK